MKKGGGEGVRRGRKRLQKEGGAYKRREEAAQTMGGGCRETEGHIQQYRAVAVKQVEGVKH